MKFLRKQQGFFLQWVSNNWCTVEVSVSKVLSVQKRDHRAMNRLMRQLPRPILILFSKLRLVFKTVRSEHVTVKAQIGHFCTSSPETTVIVTSAQVGPDPTTLMCPSCRATIVTRLEYETTTRTHVCAAILCLFICWPCVCIPYCSTSCRDANHYCPNCGSYIRTYRK